MLSNLAALCGALALAGAGVSTTQTPQVQGSYVEARTADIYTGPCFSNAEVFITGHQAILAWKVREGSWQGTDLSGLTVAAALRGSTTFSQDDPARARAVLIVDSEATPAQRDALIAMAKTLGGDRLKDVVAVRTAPMTFTVEDHATMAASDSASHRHAAMPRAPQAMFWARGLAEILTRPLDDQTDHLCGNEEVAYEPLSKGVTALPAYTLAHRFQGPGLDTRWDDPNARSAFVGHFAY